MLDNPLLILTLACLCWPGIIPTAAAFYLARHYNFRITRREMPDV